MYYIFFSAMIIGYSGVVYYTPDLKTKIVAILCLFANALLFWR